MGFCCICTSLGIAHLESSIRFKLMWQDEQQINKAMKKAFNPLQDSRDLTLCSNHFNQDSFYWSPNGQIQLKPSSKPTKFLSFYEFLELNYHKQSKSKQTATTSLPPPLIPIHDSAPPPLEPIIEKMDQYFPLDGFKFVFGNPLHLQDLIYNEKLKTFQDDLSVPSGQTLQIVSLKRFGNLLLTQRVLIRLTKEKNALVIPSESLHSYFDVTSDAQTSVMDSAPDFLLQVLQDLDAKNFGDGNKCVLLSHNALFGCWELVACCLAPFNDPSSSYVLPTCSNIDSEMSQSVLNETKKESFKSDSAEVANKALKIGREMDSMEKVRNIRKKEFTKRKFPKEHTLKNHEEDIMKSSKTTLNTFSNKICFVCKKYCGENNFKHIYSHCSSDMIYCPFCIHVTSRKEKMVAHIQRLHMDQLNRANVLNCCASCSPRPSIK